VEEVLSSVLLHATAPTEAHTKAAAPKRRKRVNELVMLRSFLRLHRSVFIGHRDDDDMLERPNANSTRLGSADDRACQKQEEEVTIS
jgi:hypothetical protein